MSGPNQVALSVAGGSASMAPGDQVLGAKPDDCGARSSVKSGASSAAGDAPSPSVSVVASASTLWRAKRSLTRWRVCPLQAPACCSMTMVSGALASRASASARMSMASSMSSSSPAISMRMRARRSKPRTVAAVGEVGLLMRASSAKSAWAAASCAVLRASASRARASASSCARAAASSVAVSKRRRSSSRRSCRWLMYGSRGSQAAES